MKSINLNSGWRLRAEDLSLEHCHHAAVGSRDFGWYTADLPCDVRMPLIATGEIPDPVEGLGCFDSEWIEAKSWWFFREFDLDTEQLPGATGVVRRARLILDRLDYGAAIYLNGNFLGEHLSAFYPFDLDVGRFLKPGANRLVIRLSAGTDRVSGERQGDFRYACTHEETNGRPDRGDRRRVFLRKPQYVFGWDWGPRVATVGIGEARLEISGGIDVGGLSVSTSSVAKDQARLAVRFELENLAPLATTEALCDITVTSPGGETVHRSSQTHFLRSGINPFNIKLEIANPALWWPNGWGEQPLYRIQVSCHPAGKPASPVVCEQRFGIRTIELDQSPLGSGGQRKFAFRVNGLEIFAKGANWIPADSLYQRVTGEKYRTLVAEAKAANFNMLRVWGGGLYETDTFYDACDEAGILLWHDLMFGCAFYPDRDPAFLALVEKELDYQLRRLGQRTCLALWCGNNEIHWCRDTAWFAGQEPYFGGEEIWNHLAPRLVERLSPTIPYWNSSPYGGAVPNGWEAGDRHHWREAMMHADMEKRITPEMYDGDLGRFVSEYGYVGPCAKTSIERYFAGEAMEVGSKVWNHHNNAFEKDTVAAGIAKHYVEPAGLLLDDYLLYAGLVQALMYGHSLESMRSDLSNGGGLFWMFADCWGEVGWTIVDYYLERKPAFYAVRRAFAPRKLILRATDGMVTCTGINDSAEPVECELEFGVVGLDGSGRRSERRRVNLPAHGRGPLFSFALPAGDVTRQLVFAAPVGSVPVLLPAVLRQTTFRSLVRTAPTLTLRDIGGNCTERRFAIASTGWAHALHFDLPDGLRADDEWFDLLPGEERLVTIRAGGPRADAEKLAGLNLRPRAL